MNYSLLPTNEAVVPVSLKRRRNSDSSLPAIKIKSKMSAEDLALSELEFELYEIDQVHKYGFISNNESIYFTELLDESSAVVPIDMQ